MSAHQDGVGRKYLENPHSSVGIEECRILNVHPHYPGVDTVHKLRRVGHGEDISDEIEIVVGFEESATQYTGPDSESEGQCDYEYGDEGDNKGSPAWLCGETGKWIGLRHLPGLQGIIKEAREGANMFKVVK